MALTIHYVADGLEARATDGPFVGIERIGLLVEPEQEDIASNVEDRVNPSRQERQGERRDSRIHYKESVEPPKRRKDDLLCRIQRLRLARRLAQTAILTWGW